jgi:hypothetical protein
LAVTDAQRSITWREETKIVADFKQYLLINAWRSITRFARSTVANENGQIMFQTVIALIALLAVVGFTIDGGLMLTRYQRDKTALDIAAQVASHAIDWPYFESTQQIRLDHAQANTWAQYYASLNSRNTIRNVTVYTWPPQNPQQVVVAGTARIPTGFWRVIGINEVNIRMTSIARPAHGISRERQ